jgi:hypothetical protein
MWERLSSREINHRGWKAAPTVNITRSFWITGKGNFSAFRIPNSESATTFNIKLRSVVDDC